MNQKQLEIFELGIALARALNGDNKAVADLKFLYGKHPEMFKDMKDLIETIERVVQEPDLVMNNPSPNKRTDDEVLAAKKLDSEKMGDVVIRNDKGTNVIFHANKKRIRQFKKLEEKLNADGRDAHTPYTQAQNCLDRRLVQKNISSADSIISKNPKHDSLNNKNSNQIPNQLESTNFQINKESEDLLK